MKIELYVLDSDYQAAERIALKMDAESARPVDARHVLASALMEGMSQFQRQWNDTDPEDDQVPTELDEMDIARDWLIARDEEAV